MMIRELGLLIGVVLLAALVCWAVWQLVKGGEGDGSGDPSGDPS